MDAATNNRFLTVPVGHNGLGHSSRSVLSPNESSGSAQNNQDSAIEREPMLHHHNSHLPGAWQIPRGEASPAAPHRADALSYDADVDMVDDGYDCKS